MASQVQRLHRLGLLDKGVPGWLMTNVAYECLMGSIAYGVSSDMSDTDVYGWTIPTKEIVFPHLGGEITGFGTQIKRFNNYQQHHIRDASTGREYDIDIYNIVRYFQLCMENNPNMIDSLFVPQRCILHMTSIAQMVRDRRREFLHKGAMHKLKGYAFAQLSKMDVKKQNVPEVHALWKFEDDNGLAHTITKEQVEEELVDREIGQIRTQTHDLFKHLSTELMLEYLELFKFMFTKNKRLDGIKRHLYDVKFGYHVVRLVSQCEQILLEGNLNLEEPGRREHMKAIRRGEVKEADLRAWFAEKERSLERLYETSTLRHNPDEASIKQLLIDCLEHHYGRLSQAEIAIPGREKNLLDRIGIIIDEHRSRG